VVLLAFSILIILEEPQAISLLVNREFLLIQLLLKQKELSENKGDQKNKTFKRATKKGRKPLFQLLTTKTIFKT